MAELQGPYTCWHVDLGGERMGRNGKVWERTRRKWTMKDGEAIPYDAVIRNHIPLGCCRCDPLKILE